MTEIELEKLKLKGEIFDLQVQFGQVRKSLQEKMNKLNTLIIKEKNDKNTTGILPPNVAA